MKEEQRDNILFTDYETHLEDSILDNITNILSERKFSKLYTDNLYFFGIDDINFLDSDDEIRAVIDCIYNQISLLEKRICYLSVDIICDTHLIVITIKIHKDSKLMVLKYEY